VIAWSAWDPLEGSGASGRTRRKRSKAKRAQEIRKDGRQRADWFRPDGGSICPVKKVLLLLYLKYRKVLRWLREDPISWSFFFHFSFFFIFCNHALLVSRYKKPYAALAMKRKKPTNANPPPASPLHRKNQTPRVHRKSFPCLPPKIIYPRPVRKQYLETDR